jgi:hypothetical protein
MKMNSRPRPGEQPWEGAFRNHVHNVVRGKEMAVRQWFIIEDDQHEPELIRWDDDDPWDDVEEFEDDDGPWSWHENIDFCGCQECEERRARQHRSNWIRAGRPCDDAECSPLTASTCDHSGGCKHECSAFGELPF